MKKSILNPCRLPLLFLLWILLLGNFAPAYGQTVAKAELLRFDAMVNRDTVMLKKWLSADLLYVHSNGLKETQQQHLQSIGSGRIIYQRMTREEVSVQKYGKIAFTNGVLSVSGSINGSPFTVHLIYMAVYKRKSGKWQLLRWQSTKL